MMKANHYRVFYSWQSEDAKSRKALELALENSKESLKQKGIDLEIDHSTLGESGTPSIDQTILRKIDECDIFLADITPVCKYNQTLGNGVQVTKEVPNPNVLLEMGYAMSALGVGYVIATAHQGKWIPRDLPFDINHRTIYCFTSSDCDLTSQILEVIDFIKKNGRHRHLDKPYFVYLLQKCFEKIIPKRRKKIVQDTIYEESTVFFKRKMASAFPGVRGLIEFTKPRDIHRHLSKLFEPPIHFKKTVIGTIDPIWWFRGGSALDISSYKRLGYRRFLIGWDEMKIKRIVAFVENGRYYSNYVYVEADGLQPTGLYGNYSKERLEELKEMSRGYVDEEYAVYRPCALFRKKITKQEEDDGSTKIFGRLVKMKRNCVETRCRYITPYNFIIAAKASPFNSTGFSASSEDYFKGLLDGNVSIEAFHEYMLRFPRRENEF